MAWLFVVLLAMGCSLRAIALVITVRGGGGEAMELNKGLLEDVVGVGVELDGKCGPLVVGSSLGKVSLPFEDVYV